MRNVTMDLGSDGRIELLISDDGKTVNLHSHVPRDVCVVCGNEWCCNPAHEDEPDPANADDLSHHECVDRIRFNGALDGIEAIVAILVSNGGSAQASVKEMIIGAIDAARNNIYG